MADLKSLVKDHAKDTPWMTYALEEAEKNVHQVYGSKHDPDIVAFHASIERPGHVDDVDPEPDSVKPLVKNDETAWCAAFVNWCLLKARKDDPTLPRGKASRAAKAWRDWGDKLTGPQFGCITVIRRDISIGILSEKEGIKTTFWSSPGELDDATSDVADIHYRWPSGVAHSAEPAWATFASTKAPEGSTREGAAFVSDCLAKANALGPKDAESGLTWGESLESPLPGCIVVVELFHVGFFAAESKQPGITPLLGGNQSDAVCEKNYHEDKGYKPVAYRFPHRTEKKKDEQSSEKHAAAGDASGPVFADKRGIVHKGSGGTSMIFPDVCLTPCGPATVPIPYPNVGMSSDTCEGPTTIFVQGQMPMAKDAQYSVSSGDEAGTSKGVMSGSTKGVCEFASYSFDVKLEGRNACRLGDQLLHNKKNGFG